MYLLALVLISVVLAFVVPGILVYENLLFSFFVPFSLPTDQSIKVSETTALAPDPFNPNSMVVPGSLLLSLSTLTLSLYYN